MPKEIYKEEKGIVYVEPNFTDSKDFNTMSNTDNIYKAPELEDYCIVVDLDVEVKGRTYTSSKNTSDNKVIRMEYTSSNNGEKVHFMEGSKIFLDKNDPTKYITSLTTNYTDCHLSDIENGGTCEMFGISSINIEYNNWMVPQVSIQFIDVRGVSLFAQEEMRHNLSSGNMNGVANNDIEGSFFKCFFTFPYPKFTLRVKGFYGQMVSYELTCSDFRSAFDSNTGNFTVNANFVGYAFSFLTDVMVNATLAAPYSEYLGKAYWEANNGNRFTVFDKNGSPTPMKTLADICKVFHQVKEAVAEELENSSPDDLDLPQDIKNRLNDESLLPVKTAHDAVIKCLESFNSGKVMPVKTMKDNTELNTIIRPSDTQSSASYAIVYDNVYKEEWKKAVNATVDAISKLNQAIDENKDKNEALKSWKTSNPNPLELLGSISVIYVGSLTGDKFYEQITDSDLKNVCSQEFEKNSSKWVELMGNNSRVLIYQDFGLNKIVTSSVASLAAGGSGNSSEDTQQLVQQVEDTLMAKKFEEIFDFPPTVENITRIFMAHMETFIQMICDCSKNIIDNAQTRTLGIAGAKLEDFTDIPSNETDSYPIPPFPKFTQEVTQDGITKREDAWIGNFGDSNSFEEIKLVEGLLKGIEEAAKDINFASSMANSSGDTTPSKCPMDYPLSYLDLFMSPNDNPFGSIDLQFPLSVYGHLCVRAFENLAYQEVNSSCAEEMGGLDAKNFLKYYKTNSSIDKLKNSLKSATGQSVLALLKEGKNAPWPQNNSAGLIYPSKNNGEYYMPMFTTNDTNGNYRTALLPFKNWKWSDWKTATNNGLSLGKAEKYSYVSNREIATKSSTSYSTGELTIFDGKMSYISNSVNGLPDGSVKSNFTQTYTASSTVIGGHMFTRHGRGVDGIANVTISNLNYSDDGTLINSSEILINLWKGFKNSKVYSENDIYSKAKAFFTSFESPALTFNDFLKANLGQTKCKQNLMYVNKFYVLYVGAQLYNAKNEQLSDVRQNIKGKFILYFKNWVDKNFSKLFNAFGAESKNKNTIESILSSLSKTKDNTSITKIISNNLTDNFLAHYEIKNNQIVPKASDDMKNIVADLAQVVAVAYKTKFYYASSNYITFPTLSNSVLLSYLNGAITTLKSDLGVEEGTVDGSGDNGDTATVTLNINGDNDDIKIGVYNYIKLLYDKWIAADPNNEFYTMEQMFDGNKPSFYFIDSFYNRIGKVLYINMSKLVDQIISSQTQNGLPLIGMLSQMYADNKFNFMCIQNFSDRANSSFMKQIFTPVSYLDKTEPDNHPEFIVMYPYEASSKLGETESGYEDDGFYFTEPTTWPSMITSKVVGSDLVIPAFGVTYGMQYQSYFTNIQVDMNTPMATEQSIKAKFMIAGASNGESSDTNTGPRHVTVGQDLYTIYSNNSYTCTVTMLGCMWIQPMMYFQLNNIPMFRGSYMIVKVSHQIEAGNATTKFVGVRMAKTSTRAVQQFLYGQSCDSMDDLAAQQEAFAHANANIGNDCDYAYYSPLPGDGEDFSADLNQRLYDNLPQKGKDLLDGKWGNGTAFKNWTILDALAAISWKEFAGTADKAVINRAAVIACMYNYRGCCKGNAFKNRIFNMGWNYFKTDNSTFTSYRAELIKIYNNPSQIGPAKTLVKDIWTNGPYKYLVGKKNTIGGTVTKEQVQKGFTTRGSSDNASQLSRLAGYGNTLYALEPYGKLYHIIGGLNEGDFKNGYAPKPTVKKEKNNILNIIKSGLTSSVESSLKSTQYYSKSSVSAVYGKGPWLKLSATGDNATNAIFDCLLDVYGDWFETIYWDKGNANMNSDAKSVIVRVVQNPPKRHTIGMSSNFAMKSNDFPSPPIRITQTSDINKSLKLCMIKYFKKNNITDANVAKGVFTTISKMDNTTINNFFELSKTSGSSIQECSSLAGYPSGLGGGVGSINITDGTIAKANDKTSAAKKQKIQQLFGGNLPTSESQALSYCEKFNVKTLSGTLSITLHKALKTSFIGIINDLNNAGFKVTSVGPGFDWRPTSSGSRSNHSYGVAVDINAGKAGNPWFNGHIGTSMTYQQVQSLGAKSCPYGGHYDPNKCIWTWNHPAVAIFAKHGWGWGGAYGDSMHFSYFGGS